MRDNFSTLDTNHNGGLTLAEAQVQIPGLTSGLFNQIDDDANSLLSMSELLDATIGEPGVLTPVYIDFAFTGLELGTAANPFNTAAEAAAYAATPGTLYFTPGNSPEITRLDRPATLHANSGTVRIGVP